MLIKKSFGCFLKLEIMASIVILANKIELFKTLLETTNELIDKYSEQHLIPYRNYVQEQISIDNKHLETLRQQITSDLDLDN